MQAVEKYQLTDFIEKMFWALWIVIGLMFISFYSMWWSQKNRITEYKGEIKSTIQSTFEFGEKTYTQNSKRISEENLSLKEKLDKLEDYIFTMQTNVAVLDKKFTRFESQVDIAEFTNKRIKTVSDQITEINKTFKDMLAVASIQNKSPEIKFEKKEAVVTETPKKKPVVIPVETPKKKHWYNWKFK